MSSSRSAHWEGALVLWPGSAADHALAGTFQLPAAPLSAAQLQAGAWEGGWRERWVAPEISFGPVLGSQKHLSSF